MKRGLAAAALALGCGGATPAGAGHTDAACRDDAVGACELACYDERAAACAWLAARAPGSTEADARTTGLYRRACDHGDAPACAELGERLLYGRGTPRDLDVGEALLRMSCETGIARACTWFGALLESGVDGRVDRDRALAAYRRACDLGHPLGCEILDELAPGEADKRVEALTCSDAVAGTWSGRVTVMTDVYVFELDVARDGDELHGTVRALFERGRGRTPRPVPCGGEQRDEAVMDASGIVEGDGIRFEGRSPSTRVLCGAAGETYEADGFRGKLGPEPHTMTLTHANAASVPGAIVFRRTRCSP